MKKIIGKTFLHPLVDYLLIGGGLSLIAIPAAAHLSRGAPIVAEVFLPMVMLLGNSAHFAASTVRLYTRENAYDDFPFLTMLLPLITLVVLTVAIAYPENIGLHIQALYLTWSPYHYARQAYGLSLMYTYRSGGSFDPKMKRLLLLACLLPFFLVITTKENAGLLWVIPLEKFAAVPPLYLGLWAISHALPVLSFLLPVLIFARMYRSDKGPMPLISLLLIVTNAIWWIIFDYQSAFIWATVFHGIQYLVIMVIFHVRDTVKAGRTTMRPFFEGLKFYWASVTLGYLLFQCWPYFYIAAGFGMAESMLLVIAVINIHHFIVDAYIWKLKKDPNYEIVVSGPAPVPSPA